MIIANALVGAFGEALVVDEGEVGVTRTVDARLGVHTVFAVAHQTVGRAGVLLVALDRRAANAVVAVIPFGAIFDICALGGSAFAAVAFAGIVLTARDRIAVVIDVASAEVDVVGVDAGVVDIADPIRGALLVEITLTRGRAARVSLGVTNFAWRTISASVARGAVDLGIALSVDARLTEGAVAAARIIADALCSFDPWADARESTVLV